MLTCTQCEDRMSDYLENTLRGSERIAVESHLSSCRGCADLLNGMKTVVDAASRFPSFDPPPWLAQRIVANTPRVVRESWVDTLAAAGRWLIEPRTAIGLLTTLIMAGWIGSLAGIPDVVSLVRNPAAVYYRAYDRAVQTFYHAPVVTEIRSEIERLREIS